MIELPVHDRQGNVLETFAFDESSLGRFVNRKLLHQAIVMFEANQRQGTAATKGVRDVVGTTRKPYRQKGTGRARMGHRRRVGSRGGGIAHGPQPRSYHQDMPRQARRAAVRSAILGKLRDGEIIVVNELKLQEPQTREMAATLRNLKADRGCLIVTSQGDENLWKSTRNLPKAELLPLCDLNVYSILLRKNLVITKDALQALPEAWK